MVYRNSEIRKKTGKALRAWRLAAGLTQWDLASRLGYVTAQFVSNWERGISLPPFEKLPALAHLLGIRATMIGELIFDAEEAALADARKHWMKALASSGAKRAKGSKFAQELHS